MKAQVIRFVFQTDGRVRAEVKDADGAILVSTRDFSTRQEAHDALVEAYRQISPWFWSEEGDFGQLEVDDLEHPQPRPFRRRISP